MDYSKRQRLHNIFHQTGYGHGANSAGNGRNIPSDFFDGFEVYITAEFPVSISVDTHVDDHGAGFDHIRCDQFFFADGADENVCLLGDFRKVLRSGMADSNGRILLQEQLSNRSANKMTAADDDSMFAGRIDTIRVEQLHDAFGCTRRHSV